MVLYVRDSATGKFIRMPAIKGDVGYVFTPHVSEDGILSWTNNGNLENPPSVSIVSQVDPSTEQLDARIKLQMDELKALINAKFGCDIESATGNITIQGNITADAVYGAVWNEDE